MFWVNIFWVYILLTFIIMVWIQLVLALKRDNVIILIHQNEVYPIVHET